MNVGLKKCPVCNSDLEIREYQCGHCDTIIKGKFRIGDLSSLTPTQQEFVKIFLCSEGNIKEVEKIMDISYPTVKNRLAEIARVLCSKTRVKDEISESILDEIDQGRISVKEALVKFRKRSKND